MDLAALILKSSSTKSEALLKLRALSAYVSAELFGGQYQPDAAEEELTDWVKEASQEIISGFDKKSFTTIFTGAEKAIKAADAIVIYLPFDLSGDNLAAISKKANSLLEIKIDPSLIAGCAIANKGVYKDYSVRAKIAEQHQEIIKLIKSDKHD